MNIKSLAQRFPNLIHSLRVSGLHDNGGAAGVDRAVCAVSGRYGELTDATSFVKNADGTWTSVTGETATGTIAGTVPTIVDGKIYVFLIGIGGSTSATANPNILLGSAAGVNLSTIGGARSLTDTHYTLTTRTPASDAEISARVFASRNSVTNREAYYKGWLKDAAALSFNDSYGSGISNGGRATAITGAVDTASFTLGSILYNHFSFDIFALDTMPSQTDLNACARILSANHGATPDLCSAWR